MARRRKHAGPGGTKLPQQVVADRISQQQSYVAKAEHGLCKIHMANLEGMAWQVGSTLTDVYSELQRIAPRSAESKSQDGEPDDS